ncbi:unnamed protein product, partial [Hymenolepis diminuta]
PEKTDLTKLASLKNEIVSEVVAQNTDEALVPLHRNLVCSQTSISWSHIGLSVAEPIRGISFILLVNSYLKWPEVMPIKSAATGTVINSQVSANLPHESYFVQKLSLSSLLPNLIIFLSKSKYLPFVLSAKSSCSGLTTR